MQIVPEKFSINDIVIRTKSELILESKSRIDSSYLELRESNQAACSGMSGEVKKGFINAEEHTGLGIQRVESVLVKLAEELEMFATKIQTIDAEAAYMAGGYANE